MLATTSSRPFLAAWWLTVIFAFFGLVEWYFPFLLLFGLCSCAYRNVSGNPPHPLVSSKVFGNRFGAFPSSFYSRWLLQNEAEAFPFTSSLSCAHVQALFLLLLFFFICLFSTTNLPTVSCSDFYSLSFLLGFFQQYIHWVFTSYIFPFTVLVLTLESLPPQFWPWNFGGGACLCQ